MFSQRRSAEIKNNSYIFNEDLSIKRLSQTLDDHYRPNDVENVTFIANSLVSYISCSSINFISFSCISVSLATNKDVSLHTIIFLSLKLFVRMTVAGYHTTTQQQQPLPFVRPGLPGWASTRRNIHPPTILIIIYMEEVLISFFRLSTVDRAQQSCEMVPRWRFFCLTFASSISRPAS